MLKVLCSGDTAINCIFFLIPFPPQPDIYYNNYMDRLTEEKQQSHIIQGSF